MRIVSRSEMILLEQECRDKFKLTDQLIIENVGREGALFLEKKLAEDEVDEFVFLIGLGNNGADGLALARHLQNHGQDTRAFLFFPKNSPLGAELKNQINMAISFGVKVEEVDELETFFSYCSGKNGPLILIDALFGTGVKLPLSNDYYDLINYVNSHAELIVSIDLPSGLDADTGLYQGNAIRAHYTLAVGFPKQGCYMASGPEMVGEIHLLDVGFPRTLQNRGDKFLLTKNQIHYPDLSRSPFADKRTFGHVLVLGGSHGLTGALVLASTAALKVGAGLVTGATWESQYPELLSRLIPEVMTGYIPENTEGWNKVIKEMDKYDAIIIGPGLARSELARRVVVEVLNNFSGPVVMDADAINVMNMKQDGDIFSLRNAPTLLTPHYGELARFAGFDFQRVKDAPLVCLKEVIEQINCAVLLKGPCTFLGFPNGTTYFNYYPNHGLAKGGAGDVLAGIIGGLLAQNAHLKRHEKLSNKYEDFTKTIMLAVQVHTLAGQVAAEKLGERAMSAGSIIESFGAVFQNLDQMVRSEISHGRKTSW